MVLYDENHEKVTFFRFWRGKWRKKFVLNNERGESLVTYTIRKPLLYLYGWHGLVVPNKWGVITGQMQTFAEPVKVKISFTTGAAVSPLRQMINTICTITCTSWSVPQGCKTKKPVKLWTLRSSRNSLRNSSKTKKVVIETIQQQHSFLSIIR
jgi:hypothetical protein